MLHTLIAPVVSSALAVSASSPVTISWEDLFIVMGMALGVNLLYAVGRRKFTDIDKMRRYNAEMKAFRSEMTAAMKSGSRRSKRSSRKSSSR